MTFFIWQSSGRARPQTRPSRFRRRSTGHTRENRRLSGIGVFSHRRRSQLAGRAAQAIRSMRPHQHPSRRGRRTSLLWLVCGSLRLVAALPTPTTNMHVKYDDAGGRLPSAEPPSVELPASHPVEMLECLKRHRYTPLACHMQNHTEFFAAAPRSPPPPAQECGIGTESNAVCFFGRGRCQYDVMRGWYCRCGGASPPVARGVHRTVESQTLSPHCIED